METDVLLEMLTKQWELERTFRLTEAQMGFWPEYADPEHDFPINLHNPMAQSFVKDAMFRVIEELMEAANELKNRPWKQTHRFTDEPKFFEEISDFWHFTLRLLLIVFGDPALTLESIRNLYFKKAQINTQRQEAGV